MKFFKFNINVKDLVRVATGLVFMLTGSLHFLSPEPFVKIVPTLLPKPLELVYLSGFFEILGGLGLLIPKTSRAAAYGLVALLVAVFPANVYHAANNVQIGGFLNNPVYQWLRLPFQAIFIWIVLWSSAKSSTKLT